MTATTSAIAARPKTTMVALLAIAFLCGAAAGALGMHDYAFRSAHHSIVLTESKDKTLERWRTDLNLTEEQSAQIRTILDDFNKYYDNVLAEGHERILQVLTPEQRRKFENSLRERY
jgi:Spy/CpxP family protein refolding chaperone